MWDQEVSIIEFKRPSSLSWCLLDPDIFHILTCINLLGLWNLGGSPDHLYRGNTQDNQLGTDPSLWELTWPPWSITHTMPRTSVEVSPATAKDNTTLRSSKQHPLIFWWFLLSACFCTNNLKGKPFEPPSGPLPTRWFPHLNASSGPTGQAIPSLRWPSVV